MPIRSPLRLWGRGTGRGGHYSHVSAGFRNCAGEIVSRRTNRTIHAMNPRDNARRLRRKQTNEERELWRALRAGRFAGFKFRRQHFIGKYYLDFYCPAGKLSVELDGFQHGIPEQREHDEKRKAFLETLDIEELRFWNHQWTRNRDGVLPKIWDALARRTGCVAVARKAENNRFIPPPPGSLKPQQEQGD
jgi:very-short-patch-repair endonuclease